MRGLQSRPALQLDPMQCLRRGAAAGFTCGPWLATVVRRPTVPGELQRLRSAQAAASASISPSSVGFIPSCSHTAPSTSRHHSPGACSCSAGGSGVPPPRRCRCVLAGCAAGRFPASAPPRPFVVSLAAPAVPTAASSFRRRARGVAAGAAPAAAPPPPPTGPAAVDGDDDGLAAELYLGPAVDLVSALEILSCTRTFTEMCVFLENNSHLFRGPEVAAVVLQAAAVSELSAQRQMAAAMEVAERQTAAAAAASEAGGEGDEGALTPEALAGAMDDVLRAAGPRLGPVGGDGTADGRPADDESVLDELDAADQLLEWATPQVRAHIKRYPPDGVLALLSALAQLQQYDKRLMELAAETFKTDPRDRLRRAAASSAASSSVAADGGRAATGTGAAEWAAVVGDGDEGGGGSGGGGGSDPWFSLVSLAGAFARLGHYDRGLLSAIAQQAVELMPEVWQRAEAEEAEAEAAEAEGGESTVGGGDGGGGVTATVVVLVSAFLELHHLDPGLMQAAGEHLAAFSHRLAPDLVSEALLAFATFNARNPAFYSLLLRRLVEAVEVEVEGDGVEGGEAPATQRTRLTPRGAGALYRACVLIRSMGDVPELAPPPPPQGVTATATADTNRGLSEPRRVGLALSSLLRGCLAAFPLTALQAAPLGRPTPEQLQAAAAAGAEDGEEGGDVELLEAWAATGLLTVPQILSTLQQLPVEPLPPSALAADWEAAAPSPSRQVYGNRVGAAAVAGDDADGVESALVGGGADAVAWVPPDALLLYDGSESGSGIVVRIAVKALDEGMHCCRNVGLDLDLEQDRPGPRSGSGLSSSQSSDPQWWRRRRQLRVRGPALSELRCLEAWGWRVLVVPVEIWGLMDPADRRTWLVRRLDEIAAEGPPDGAAPMGPELWV